VALPATLGLGISGVQGEGDGGGLFFSIIAVKACFWEQFSRGALSWAGAPGLPVNRGFLAEMFCRGSSCGPCSRFSLTLSFDGP